MVAKLLQACGLSLGPREELNPACEHAGILQINDALLKHLGLSPDRIADLPAGWEFDPALIPLADRA